MTARPDACRHCGRTLRSMGQTVTDQPDTVRHYARGLCHTCHDRHADDYPRLQRPNTELLAEVAALAGESPQRIADRLGVTPAAIARAAHRAGLPNIASTYNRLVWKARTEGPHP